MEAALDTPKATSKQEYGAKILFGLLTLAFLWSSGGGDGLLFWHRQWLLALICIVGTGTWVKFTTPLLWSELTGKPRPEEMVMGLRWGVGAALLVSGMMALAVLLLPRSPWLSWDVLESYSVQRAFWALPLLLVTSYVIEFFLRGYLSQSWGRGSVAFLESVTIAVGFQHVLPFALLLPTIFVWHHVALSYGLRSAAIARVVWSFLVVVFAWLISTVV